MRQQQGVLSWLGWDRLFETFNVPAMYVAIQAVLSQYANGRTTGMYHLILRYAIFSFTCSPYCTFSDMEF